MKAMIPMLAACLWGLVGGLPLGAEENALPGRSELPLVIPHPQSIHVVAGDDLLLGEAGRSAVEVVVPAQGGLLDEAAGLIQAALSKRGLAERHERVATRIVLKIISAAGGGPFPELTAERSAAIAKSDQAYVICVKPERPAEVSVIGASPLAAYYGATTIVQLIESPRPGSAVLRPVEVADYPDTPQRMSADWVLQWDWEVNGYDWGDGLAAFIERCKRKIDLCSQYKVNRVRFLGGRIAPGAPYTADRYSRIQRFGLELNRYARRKGVALQYSSSSWGLDYYGWGLPYPEPWILNRQHYPDGPVYSCVGGTVGGCLSNDSLIAILVERHKQLVRDLEPGSIYLHQIDAATYSELARLWKTRCPQCRRRFPHDEPYAPDGYAGAVARLYNAIVAGLKSVKNARGDYDAARDLEIVLASPGYSYSAESDADWDKDLKYFAEIGGQLVDRKNVQITFREQFKRLDDRGLRIPEMAAALEQAGWPGAPFVFAVQGAGLLLNSRMFVSSPVLTGIDEGAATLYNFNGHVHSEVQVLANVNYAWNHHAPGSVDPLRFPGRRLHEEALQYAVGARHSEFLYGRFLDTACEALYGKQAAPWMAALFRLERDRGSVLAVPAWVDHQWKNAGIDWRAQAERNLQAKRLAEQALAVCDPQASADVSWLVQCLEVGARLCRLCDAIHREKRSREETDALAAEILTWLEKNFQFQTTEPDGGDPGLWKSLVARIAKGPPRPSGEAVVPAMAAESSQDGRTTVEVSSVLPGYRPASVLTSDPSGKDWGKDGGWNDATAGQFPDTLEIRFSEPRPVDSIRVFTLADHWQDGPAVDANTEFSQWGVTALDVEVRDANGTWRTVRQFRENHNVLLSVKPGSGPIAAVRFRVLQSADGLFSRIVHVDWQ
ncbi:MAG: hypothetical protein HUU20_20935 [Pirellulales bacterium]|nr:hypothetical protein [Pirellulales bacterium]